MRKYFGIIILAILVSSITLSVNAQDNKTTSKKTVNSQTFRGPNFVDKNNDGVCDNYGKWKNSQRGKCWANGNGKGNRRGRGRCNGNGNGNGRR